MADNIGNLDDKFRRAAHIEAHPQVVAKKSKVLYPGIKLVCVAHTDGGRS